MNQKENKEERCLLVGVDTGEVRDFSFSMEELGNLAEACDMQPIGMITQNLPYLNKGYCVGEGKLEEIRAFLCETDADSVVFNNTLSPAQLSNLQSAIDVPVYDRTGLILEIFARRARSREAILQVEIARLRYMLPRLTGLHKQLSRQGGAGGSMSSKGAGETKLELDRRKLEHRLTMMNRELKELRAEREVRKSSRKSSGIYRVALIGYTNAGKSTIMNAMQARYGVYAGAKNETGKEVLEKDMLFATLDTTLRRIHRTDAPEFLLADTVGFISDLPHQLVEAFRSTLDEALEADLILQVVDYSDPNYPLQTEVTTETLKDLNADTIPRIPVFNKCDKCDTVMKLPLRQGNTVYLSAREEEHMEALTDIILERLLKDYTDKQYLFPYNRSDIPAYLKETGSLLSQEYLEDGILVKARVNAADAGRLAPYEAE